MTATVTPASHCPDQFPEVLGPKELAAFLRVSEGSVLNARDNDPTFPKPKMVGTLPRWTKRRVLAWLDDVDDQPDEDAPAVPTAEMKRDRGEQPPARADDAKRSAKRARTTKAAKEDPFRV